MKVAKPIGLLYNLNNFIPETIIKTLYTSLIHPYLSYGRENNIPCFNEIYILYIQIQFLSMYVESRNFCVAWKDKLTLFPLCALMSGDSPVLLALACAFVCLAINIRDMHCPSHSIQRVNHSATVRCYIHDDIFTDQYQKSANSTIT